MTRWAETVAEVQHIREMNSVAPSFGIVWVRLKDGTEFYGVIRELQMGSNVADVSPPTKWFSDMTLQLENKETVMISLLDASTLGTHGRKSQLNSLNSA
jgi:hypothetical protein